MTRFFRFLYGFFLPICFAVPIQAKQQTCGESTRQFFIENKGQWPAEVKYLSRSGGMNAWITDSGVVYDYYQIIRDQTASDEFLEPIKRREQSDLQNYRVNGHVVRVLLENDHSSTVFFGAHKLETYYNYFIGNDPEKWVSYVGLYEEVEMKDVYDGINIRYYFDNGQVRYDYQVAAGADISLIQLRLEGADGYEINRDGELRIQTSLGEVVHGKLYAYQLQEGIEKKVSCRFEQKPNGLIGIEATGHDETKPLIIDPLVYSTKCLCIRI